MAKHPERRSGMVRRWVRRLRWLRRLALLGAIAGGAAKVIRSRSRGSGSDGGPGPGGAGRPSPTGGSPSPTHSASVPRPERVPEPVGATAVSSSGASATTVVDDNAQAWVPPVGKECPATHPVKANDNSHIYHQPGGRFYDRTVPERCYTSPEAAESDGYRAAKA